MFQNFWNGSRISGTFAETLFRSRSVVMARGGFLYHRLVLSPPESDAPQISIEGPLEAPSWGCFGGDSSNKQCSKILTQIKNNSFHFLYTNHTNPKFKPLHLLVAQLQQNIALTISPALMTFLLLSILSSSSSSTILLDGGDAPPTRTPTHHLPPPMK
jgi:hypothetical protein